MVSGSSALAEPRYISTFAGNGVAGLSPDGLPPRSTALYLPQDGVFGPDGDFYIVDWNNHRIRRIRGGIEGTVETVAGTGELGDAPDGIAAGVRFNHPTNIAFDRQGRIIIAAWHNSKVKRLDLTTGLVENLAGTGARSYGGDGGPGNAAILDLPSSAVEDSHGNICISDQANFRLRRLDPTGIITTMCGQGIPGYTGDDGLASLATLRSPVGQSAAPSGRLTLDAQDRIYIADTGNHVIRRIDVDGIIRTIAGNGFPGYAGDGGPATAASLNTPSDVAVAADGTFYIADTKNNAIRKVSPEGIISTIAGTGLAGFSGDGGLGRDAKLDRPYGVALRANGDIVIADTHNHRLRILTEEPRAGGTIGEDPDVEIIPCTNELGTICTYAGTGFSGFTGDGRDRQKTSFYWPFDVEFTPSGRVYVLDWNNHRVREVMPDQTFRTVIGTDFVGDGPPDQNDFIAPGAPGLTIDLNHPTDLQELPNGDLMIMAWHNHKIRVLNPDTGMVQVVGGSAPGFAGDGGPVKAARMNQPRQGVLDPEGHLFIIDQRSQRIRRIANFATLRGDAIISTVAGTGTLGFNGDGPALATQFSFPTGTNPEPTGGMAMASDGALYFADTNNHRIRKLTFPGGDYTAGVIQTIAGTGVASNSGDNGPAIDAAINYPQDMEIGPDGRLYFADTNNNRIRRIDLTSGIIEAVAGTGEEGYSGDGGPALQATFQRPFGIAFDSFGNLYVSDTFNGRIRKIKLSTVPEGPEPILPADYLASFVEVRDCRYSFEHGGVYIRVLTNPEAAQAYQENASALPAGTVVVKEEFSDGHCEQDELIRWRVMRKEAPGFDVTDGDWHWQLLTPRREVVSDTKDNGCISCHRQEDCVRRDFMCAVPGSSSGMKVVLDNLPAALLSVSGTPPTDGHAHGHEVNFDVYAVGVDPRDGRGPFVLNFDGQEWRRLATGASGDLWWITDRMIEGDFYMCGTNGLMLRFTHATKQFERQTTPGGKLLFGVWGTDRQHLWAVGGDLSNPDRGGAIWRYVGTEWVDETSLVDAGPEGLPTLYKIWGTGPNDIYAVGSRGTCFRYNGVRWVKILTGTTRPLFTVHGDANRVFATGGQFGGVLLELEGESFVDRTPAGAPQFNGVFALLGGPAAAVGIEGAFARLGADGWEMQTPVATEAPADFHATWLDASGGVWAVGGDLTSVDLRYGVLAYAGNSAIGREFEADACPPGVTGEPGTVSYTRDIVPIFRRNGCLDSKCHAGTSPQSDYDMSTYEGLFGPGVEAKSHGMCNIVPGNPGASYLLEKLRADPRAGVRMPNGLNALRDDQIALIYTWIREGAVRNVSPARAFTRGDVDLDGRMMITDAIFTLGHLFRGEAEPGCLAAADFDDDGVLGITDAIAALGYLFLGTVAPAQPFPACGLDPTPGDVSCVTSRC